MKKLLQSLFILCFTFFTAAAQERTISGTVTSSEDGLPIPGTSVKIKEVPKSGVATGADGKFTIKVPANGKTLVISSIGFAPREIPATGSGIKVVLSPDSKTLGEVVVTALGIQRTKKSTGYSNENLTSKELTDAKVVNLATGLQSKVSGLQVNLLNNGVNPSTRIVLRGNRSLTGTNTALIVVDGVPVESSILTALNPNDVESVNVLKGANAAALYGSDGVNGVLIVTTKKGSAGTTKINFSSTTSLETVAYMPDMQYGFGNGYDLDTYVAYENTSWGPKYDGSMVQVGPTLVDGSKYMLPYSALKDEKSNFWNTGTTFQNDLSFSGGDEKTKFFLSAQDVKIKGVVPQDESRRTGVRFNGSRNFGKLDISANLNYTSRSVNVTTSPVYDNLLNVPQNIPITQLQDWKNNKFAAPDGFFSAYYENPYWGIDNERSDARSNIFQGTVEANYKFADWLKATYRVGLYNTNAQSKAYGAKVAYTNAYSRPTASNGSVTDAANNLTRINSDLIVSANKKFGDFNLGLMVGNNIRDNYSESVSAAASALVVPGLYNLSNRLGEATVSSTKFNTRTVAFFGEFTADYKDYLFLSVTGRQESVSQLKKDNRSYFYPGASLSYVFTDAIPALKSNILSSGKLMLSANRTGNVNLSAYNLQTTLGVSSGFPYGNIPGYTVGNVYNNDRLTPEFVKSYEAGVQLGFLQNRVNFDATYAYSKADGQIVSISTSTATGYSNARVNAGRVDNNMIELSLRATPVRTADWNWELGVNYTNYKNEVVDLYQGVNEVELGGYANAAYIYAIKGEVYPMIKTTAYERDPQGRIVVNGTTGNPVRSAAMQIQGQTTPDQTWGLNTRLRYKGVTFAAQLDYRTGNVFYTNLGRTMDFTGLSAHSAAFDRQPFVVPNSVIKNTDGSFTPNTSIKTADGGFDYWYSQYSQVQENYTVDGSFVKLREISLSYELPKAFLAKQKVVKSASIGLVGRNLFTWLPKENVFTDPEMNFSEGNASGLQDLINPPTRIYGFTLNVSF
jgi:TonB-linked SusC/RagA family outer membrane protein